MKSDKKYRIPYIGLLPIIIITICLIKIINQSEILSQIFEIIMAIVMPIIMGLCIAYILEPGVKFFIREFNFNRKISIVITFVTFLLIFALLIIFIIPIIIKSSASIAEKFPSYLDGIKNFIEKTPYLSSQEFRDLITSKIPDFSTEITKYGSRILSSGLSAIFSTTSSVIDFFISLFLSIYFLFDIEKLKSGVKRFMYAFFNVDSVDSWITFMRKANSVFSNYIVGKLIESLVLSVITAIMFYITRVPYAAFMGLIVGFTNLIPYIGAFIGGTIPVFIALIDKGLLIALLALAMVVIAQQIDNLLIAPKILGDKVGLSSVGVMISIIVGGALWGAIGMLISVPIFAVLRILYEEIVHNKLVKKGISDPHYKDELK